MFSNLVNFGFKRNFIQAVGFYIAYLVLTILVAVLLAAVIGMATGNSESFEFGLMIGNVSAILVILGLSYLILDEKNLLRSFPFILLSLIAGVLAYFGGGMLGLIPIAYLTTRESKVGITQQVPETTS